MRPYSPGDAALIALDGLRSSDVEEVAGLGRDPAVALLESVQASPTDTFTVTADGHPVAVFGVSPIYSPGCEGWGAPWFLASDGIYKVRRQFANETRYWVEWMNSLYAILFNYVDATNRVSRLWLRKAGFEILPPKPIGVDGKLYAPFHRIRRSA